MESVEHARLSLMPDFFIGDPRHVEKAELFDRGTFILGPQG